MLKYSAIGPKDNAGKKFSAPTKITININKNTNIALLVDKVPAVTATFFFCTKLPAIAKIPTIGNKRAKIIVKPILVFKNGVLALKPAKAEPLFPP